MLPDPAGASRSLDNDYGITHGPNSPDVHEVALLTADGVELDPDISPGYARATVAAEDWPAAIAGSKSVLVTFGEPTAEWQTAAGWQLIDPANGVLWDRGDLFDQLVVTGPGAAPLVAITVSYQPA